MTSPLIAEDLLLLLLDDASGRPLVDGTCLPRVLAGAVLLELALDGYVALAEKGEAVRKGRIVVRRDDVPHDPILADAVHAIAQAKRPLLPASAIEKLDAAIRPAVFERVIERGWISEHHRKVLGIFPARRWPALEESHERGVREQLAAVLIDGAEPDTRAAALISLLTAVNAAAKVFPLADTKAVRRRARTVADGQWAAHAVRKAVDAINAGLITTAVAASVNSSS